MINRRQFLVQTTALAASSMAFSHFSSAEKIRKIGVQLYTLRSLMKDDCVDVLQQLGKAGYTEIESFPSGKGHYWGKSAKDFFSLASENGMNVISTHIPYGKPAGPTPIATVLSDFEPFVEAFAKEGGKFIVCPYLDKSLRTSIEQYSAIAEDFNKAGEICRNHGVRFCYHNHDFEFVPIGSEVPYQHLLKNTDPSLVKMELDLYWAAKANQSIAKLFQENPGRFPLVHVKDMGKTNQETVEVGNGTIPFKDIFAISQTAGIQHYFVEQDHCPGNPLESVQQSLRYLRNLEF